MSSHMAIPRCEHVSPAVKIRPLGPRAFSNRYALLRFAQQNTDVKRSCERAGESRFASEFVCRTVFIPGTENDGVVSSDFFKATNFTSLSVFRPPQPNNSPAIPKKPPRGAFAFVAFNRRNFSHKLFQGRPSLGSASLLLPHANLRTPARAKSKTIVRAETAHARSMRKFLGEN
jgi:hypothetical protein